MSNFDVFLLAMTGDPFLAKSFQSLGQSIGPLGQGTH